MGKKLTDQDKKERRRKVVEICELMRSGFSAHKSCEKIGVPQSTLARWVNEDTDLAEQYARARSDLIEKMADELLEISDKDVETDASGKKDWAAVQKHKLQVDTRKWLLSKLAPKKFGDRLQVAGDDESPLRAKVEHAIDVTKLSTDALAQIVAARKATDAD